MTSIANAHLIDSILRNPAISNLVEIYDPVKLFRHVLKDPSNILGGKRGIRHDNLAPDFDLRETSSAYYLEGEFPGVRDRSAIKLQWLDQRTLRVESKIEKIDLKEEWPEWCSDAVIKEASGASSDEHAQGADKNAWADANDVKIEKTPPKPVAEESVLTWLSERREGLCTRSFRFPTAVNVDGTQARLLQGLLRIRVPKVERTEVEPKKVDIK